jgi:hypothetical protein
MLAGETPAARRAERVAEMRGEMREVFQRAWMIAMRRWEPVGEVSYCNGEDETERG